MSYNTTDFWKKLCNLKLANPEHVELSIDGVTGWLDPEDCKLLYKEAYEAKGSILELGCYKGLSSHIIQRAIYDAGEQWPHIFCDISMDNVIETKIALVEHGFKHVIGVEMDAIEFVKSLWMHFDLIFVDVDHSFDYMIKLAEQLTRKCSGTILFHDYIDLLNQGFGVKEACDNIPTMYKIGEQGLTGVFRCI